MQSGAIDFSDILKIRSGKHGEKFRKWLEEISKQTKTSDQETKDIASLYNAACKETGVAL